jgi:hypothetical protein
VTTGTPKHDYYLRTFGKLLCDLKAEVVIALPTPQGLRFVETAGLFTLDRYEADVMRPRQREPSGDSGRLNSEDAYGEISPSSRRASAE